MRFFVYLLKSLNSTKTYVGFTTDPKKRLRQHNGEIKGGAKKTRNHRPWQMVCQVCGFETKKSALQFEWMWQHPLKSLKSRDIVRNNVTGKIGSHKRKIQELKYLLTFNPELEAIIL